MSALPRLPEPGQIVASKYLVRHRLGDGVVVRRQRRAARARRVAQVDDPAVIVGEAYRAGQHAELVAPGAPQRALIEDAGLIAGGGAATTGAVGGGDDEGGEFEGFFFLDRGGARNGLRAQGAGDGIPPNSTVLFDVDDANIKNLLRSCATNPDYFFDSPSEDALKAAFQTIGDSLANLRISK